VYSFVAKLIEVVEESILRASCLYAGIRNNMTVSVSCHARASAYLLPMMPAWALTLWKLESLIMT